MRYFVLALLCAGMVFANLNGAEPASGKLVTEVTSPNRNELSTSVTSLHGPIRYRTAAWPLFRSQARPLYESYPVAAAQHPAVARIIVPERDATAYGSGTLVDVRDQYGLVITNWHVVSDSHGNVEVVFPSGFRSQARPLKVDSDWDLAALVIWRPPIAPVKLASQPPRPGEHLTIHGYGQGRYRIATGRCTNYYAPRPNYPLEVVELDAEARQGDSGGPIFNQRGELAGVLFGAGQGTTLGSFAPRVSTFLATLAPDIGQAKDQELVAVAERPAPNVGQRNHPVTIARIENTSSPWSSSLSQEKIQVTQVATQPMSSETACGGPATSVASMARDDQST
jgi:S1-C subfamily serine protease